MPELNRDGLQAVRSTTGNIGLSSRNSILRAVSEHMSLVADVCMMQDSDINILQNPLCPQAQKTLLLKSQQEAMTAVRIIDRPNVHRLHELARCTLAMLGHVSIVGKLVLEKAHQILKRALKLSNNREAHVLSMKTIAIDDWQGRITLLVLELHRGEDSAYISCFRLLSGREAVASINGSLSLSQKEEVIHTMGPQPFLKSALERKGKSVISSRCFDACDIKWAFHGKAEVLGSVQETNAHHNAILQYLRRAFLSELDRYSISLGSRVLSSFPNGIPGPTFHNGCIIETLCYRPLDPSYHNPFLLQMNCCNSIGARPQNMGPSLWYVSAVLCFTESKEHATVYLAVQPCVMKRTLPPNNAYRCRHEEYCVDRSSDLCFAIIDAIMRKIGVIETADDDFSFSCILGDGNNSSTRAVTPPGGFLALTRAKGYPRVEGNPLKNLRSHVIFKLCM